MPPNAIDLLTEDHDKVRDLLSELGETSDRSKKTRSQLLEKIREELEVHTRIEEELFYPAYREAGGGDHDEQVAEAREEHRAVTKLVLPDLEKTDPTSPEFAGRAKVLRDLVEHHAEEEEEEMFPAARETLSEQQLDDLGQQLEQRRRALSKQERRSG